MASPILESQAVSPTLSDHGYHPGLSGPDLAIGRAMTTAQAQWTAHFNQLQTCQRLLEARLESQTQMMSHMSDVMSHLLLQSQPQPPQRRQGRPHPGKSMRAKKRKQAQALLEQANSSSEGASDADCTTTTAARARASSALSTTLAASAGAASPPYTPPLRKEPSQTAPSSTHEAAATMQSEAAVAPTTAQPAQAGRSASVDAAAALLAPPAATQTHEAQQLEEGWLDVAAHREESSTSIRAPPSVAAATSSLEANKEALVKEGAEEACGKLLEVVKKELMEATQVFQVVVKEALATTFAEGLQQHSQRAQRDISAAVEVLKQQHAEEAVGAKQAFQDQLAAFKEEMLQQLHAEQHHGLEALKEEQQKEATTIRTALTSTLAPLATLQHEQQSHFEQLRQDLQEVQRKNEELLADSAQQFRPVGDDVAAMKLELAELKAHIAHLAEAAVQQASCSAQQPRAQEAPEAPVAAAHADAGDPLGTQEDLPPPPGLSVAPAAGQTETPTPMQTTVQPEEAVSEATDVDVTAAASLSLTTLAPTLAPRTPPRCRVVACRWLKGYRTGHVWKLREEEELVEPFLVTATTLGDVKALFCGDLCDFFKELKNFDGSHSLPLQEQDLRRSLQDLGCGEGSLLKLHFRSDWTCGSYWWSYEVIGCNSH